MEDAPLLNASISPARRAGQGRRGLRHPAWQVALTRPSTEHLLQPCNLNDAFNRVVLGQYVMAWAKPEYPVQDINAAGKTLATFSLPIIDYHVLEIVNNWRSIHSYPLNAFQITLRRRARELENGIIVAQRIKRIESIHAKLARENSMKLSQMQGHRWL